MSNATRTWTTPLVPILATILLAGCSNTAEPNAAPPAPAVTTTTVDPVAKAITDRYGDCLVKLKFTKPFDIHVYPATHKANVSATPGVITFRTATSNTGNLLITPEDADNSARALAAAGC